MKSKQHFDPSVLAEWRSRLDRTSPVPLYKQLKDLVLEKIECGNLQNGDAMPTEYELKTVLDISRPTIRQCMQDLVSEGYLTRLVGKGTYVRRKKMELNYINRHESFSEIIKKHGYDPHTTVVDFRIVSGIPQINDQLQIGHNEPIYCLKRTYYADKGPIFYAETYLQASRFPNLQDFDFSRLSLYQTLKNAYSTKVDLLKREVGVECGTADDVQKLGIQKGKPVFEVRNWGLGEDGLPIEYTYARYRSEVIKFTNYLKC